MGTQSPDEKPKVEHLNGLTASKFLAIVGQQPWRIKKYDVRIEQGLKLPEFLLETKITKFDLFTREFRLVAQKMADIVGDAVLLRHNEQNYVGTE
jgi:hypothetical protein